MSSQLKPIKAWGYGSRSANPVKLAMILNELNLPFEAIHVPFADVKNPEYTVINPNGRLPAIQDPNTGITLWESGAIIEYLVDHYDKECRLSFPPGTPESYHAKQWLYFQTSGQGPYYGQLFWFKLFHSTQVPSAIERYIKEVNRVTGVLEGHLSKEKKEHGDSIGFDGPWLVGNKISYADISFVSWQKGVEHLLDKDAFDMDKYPVVKEWLAKMTARPAIKTANKQSTSRA